MHKRKHGIPPRSGCPRKAGEQEGLREASLETISTSSQELNHQEDGERVSRSSGPGSSRCRGPEAGGSLECSGTRKEARGAGERSVGERGRGGSERGAVGRAGATVKSGHFALGVSGRQWGAASRGRVLVASVTLALVKLTHRSAGE